MPIQNNEQEVSLSISYQGEYVTVCPLLAIFLQQCLLTLNGNLFSYIVRAELRENLSEGPSFLVGPPPLDIKETLLVFSSPCSAFLQYTKCFLTQINLNMSKGQVL